MSADQLDRVYDGNGARYDVAEPARVPFGTGHTQNVPLDWAGWILTTMRADELAGKKPRPFSALLGACVLEMQAK
jgi:hypothetical protein